MRRGLDDASLKRQWDETELKLKDFFECECAAPDRALPRDISDGSFAGNPVEQFLSSICTYVGTNDRIDHSDRRLMRRSREESRVRRGAARR
jgi:hypothetical protein